MNAPTTKNPHREDYDEIPGLITLRVLQKQHLIKSAHHNEIIPKTSTHAAFVLGAQPTRYFMKGITEKYQGDIRAVSMLAKHERLVEGTTETGQEVKKLGRFQAFFSRFPLYDHSGINPQSGRIVPTAEVRDFQKEVFDSFNTPKGTNGPNAVYCHCMAGRSRSFFETMVFLHQYAKEAFDFELFDFVKLEKSEDGIGISKYNPDPSPDPSLQSPWKKNFDEISSKIGSERTADLMFRLKFNPTFSDIAEYVKLRRPGVTHFSELKADQAGLVGVMSLDSAAHQEETFFTKRDPERLLTDAQDIGLMLKLPLDSAFREKNDVEEQMANFIKAIEVFKKTDINLLTSMVVPRGAVDIVGNPNLSAADKKKGFLQNFDALRPAEQARFAILLKEAEAKITDPLGLGLEKGAELTSEALAQRAIKAANAAVFQDKADRKAKIAAAKEKAKEQAGNTKATPKQIKKAHKKAVKNAVKETEKQGEGLPAGDQIELLRNFGIKAFGQEASSKGVVAKIIKKITSGNKIDKHNPGIQLAELFSVADNDSLDDIKKAFRKLNSKNQTKFLQQLRVNHPELYRQHIGDPAAQVDLKARDSFLKNKTPAASPPSHETVMAQRALDKEKLPSQQPPPKATTQTVPTQVWHKATPSQLAPKPEETDIRKPPSPAKTE